MEYCKRFIIALVIGAVSFICISLWIEGKYKFCINAPFPYTKVEYCERGE